MDIKTENEWQRYNRVLIPAGSRKRAKSFSITQEALDLAKQDFANRGGEIEVLEPSYISCLDDDPMNVMREVDTLGTGVRAGRNYQRG